MEKEQEIKTNSQETKMRFSGFELKLVQEEDGEWYSEGWVATTHPDRAPTPEVGTDGDILSKEVMHQIANFINNDIATIKSVGATRAVSYRHDWIKKGDPDIEPPGMVVPPAEVKEYGDGHYGVWAKVHHNKNHPQFDKILYEVKHGYLPGYSIEYKVGDFKKVTLKDKVYRFIKSFDNYVGQAFAHARLIANPKAIITGVGYKEITDNLYSIKEETQMDIEKILKKKEAGESLTPEEEAALKEYESKKKKDGMKEVEESSESEEVEAKESVEEKAEESNEEVKESESEEVVEVEAKEAEKSTPSVKEILAELKETKEFKSLIDGIKVEEKVMKNKGEDKMEKIQFKEFVDAAIQSKEVRSNTANELFYESAGVKETIDTLNKVGKVQTKHNFDVKCSGKGLKISGYQTKDTLVVGDNASSYTQEDVEFADVFQPGIIDTFNNQINLFGFLPKIPHAEGAGEFYQWKMVTDKDPDSVSTFVSRDSISVTKNFAEKQNYQTPLKIARRGVSVSDFVRRYASRSLRDLLQLEIDLQMKELMNDVNAALFDEVADGAGNAPLGLEAVADSAGNTTLYGKTRSTANRLSPDAAGDTYTAVGGNLTEALLRAKITQLETEGSRMADIAIIASPTTRDYLFNLLDGSRRFNTTEALFGFNRVPVASFDGVPIIVDSDCNSDAIYVIDTAAREGANIVVGMEPQVIELAKVGMSTEAVIEMHFAFVYHQPRRIGMLDTLSGP